MSTTRRARRTAVAVAVGLGAAAPSPAPAAVTPPALVSPSGLIVRESDVSSGGGRTVILMAAARAGGAHAELLARIGGTRVTTLRLASGRVESPHVAVGEGGRVVAAWVVPGTTSFALRAAIAEPGHSFGPAVTIDQAPAMSFGGVVVTREGRAVITWRPNSNPAAPTVAGTPVRASVAEPGIGFGTTRVLGDSLYDPPSIAAGPDGGVTIAWTHVPDPPTPTSGPPTDLPATYATTMTSTSKSFATPVVLDRRPGTWGPPTASGGPGGLGIAWRHDGQARSVVMSQDQAAFGPTEPLPAAGRSSISDRVSLGLPSIFTRAAVWLKPGHSTSPAAVFASASVGGAMFGPAQQLSTPAWSVGIPATGALTDRSATVWAEARQTRSRVLLSVLTSSNAWTRVPIASGPAINLFGVHAAFTRDAITITWLEHVAGTSADSGGRVLRATYRP